MLNIIYNIEETILEISKSLTRFKNYFIGPLKYLYGKLTHTQA